MKTIKDFLNDIDTNEQLKISLENIKSVEEMCKKLGSLDMIFQKMNW